MKESLVKQDDALFRQLLALRSSIHDIRQLQLRNQDRQDFCRSSSCSRSSSRSNSGVHSLSGSSSSLNSTDNTDDADPDQDHPQVMLLTRNKISYPPHKLRVNKLTSGSSPSSVCSSSGSSEEEWPQARILKSGRRLPQTVSPHLSFYRTKEHQRQGSYDSGIHASEPSDAEVFVWNRIEKRQINRLDPPQPDKRLSRTTPRMKPHSIIQRKPSVNLARNPITYRFV